MTSIYNKSEIMKKAHSIRKEYGYTLSESLIIAWTQAKKAVSNNKPSRNILLATLRSTGLLNQANKEAEKEIKKDEARKERQRQTTRVANMNSLSNSLNSYYSSNGYKAD